MERTEAEVREMKDTRPYWKVIVSLSFSLIATILFVVIGYGLLRLFLPFVIGWVIAFIANPMVCWLEKRLKIVKKLGSAITIVVVLGVVVGAIYLVIASIVREASGLISDLPQMYGEMKLGLLEIGANLQGVFRLLPEEAQQGWNTIVSNLGAAAGEWIGTLSEPTVEVAGNVAKSIPSVFIGMIVMIISAYFFVAEREEVIAWVKKVTPKPIEERMAMVIFNLKYAIGGYFKAQFQIMLVLGAIMFVGFTILGVKYAIVLAILFAFLDFLPFFGTAITLVPWAIYNLLGHNYKMAIGLVVLYVLTQLIRQLIQPKLVGDEVGLKALPTLVLLYLGYKVGSIWGMIFAVPIGMIVINMYHAGAFDYILDDVKILIRGILKLRK